MHVREHNRNTPYVSPIKVVHNVGIKTDFLPIYDIKVSSVAVQNYHSETFEKKFQNMTISHVNGEGENRAY